MFNWKIQAKSENVDNVIVDTCVLHSFIEIHENCFHVFQKTYGVLRFLGRKFGKWGPCCVQIVVRRTVWAQTALRGPRHRPKILVCVSRHSEHRAWFGLVGPRKTTVYFLSVHSLRDFCSKRTPIPGVGAVCCDCCATYSLHYLRVVPHRCVFAARLKRDKFSTWKDMSHSCVFAARCLCLYAILAIINIINAIRLTYLSTPLIVIIDL